MSSVLQWVSTTGVVAHIVQFGREPWAHGGRVVPQPERRPGWLSMCGHNVFIPSDRHLEVHIVGPDGDPDLPTMRWCTGCISAARRKVADFVDAGVIDEIPPGTVAQ